MNIKKVNFPSFDEWKEKGFEFKGQIGDYYVDVRPVCWSTSRENPETTYSIAASTRDNPLNVYSPTIYRETFHYFHDDEKNLKAWYEEQIKKFNEFWEKFIKKTYLEN